MRSTLGVLAHQLLGGGEFWLDIDRDAFQFVERRLHFRPNDSELCCKILRLFVVAFGLEGHDFLRQAFDRRL